ncbi:chemotaxis protein CheA [Devosia rhodophyticola]|uniref:Chemotaxis protein CheA n=1 Tax=Devosia rhodophyticola TaxID=3026423 RepID=A0ABY7YT77_9HYPH|nr:chemotaxis protein CheA [Devosia rhodophyticola]WDR04581.1 chemotaxis protein CheA [Devosia rhodophyticola]
MSDLDEFKVTYFDECSELLGELEEIFAVIELGDRDSARINAAFRAVHSIKGGAGAFGFSALVEFAHGYETLMDQVRDGRVSMSDDVVTLCIRANDLLADFVGAARSDAPLAAEHGLAEKLQMAALAEGQAIDGELDDFDFDFTPIAVDLGKDEAETKIEVHTDQFADAPSTDLDGQWEISFRPHAALYARANDPLLLFRELAALGHMSVQAQMLDLPPLADFEPFGVYCLWTISLVSPDLTEAMIREVFEFVEGDCDISVVRLGEQTGTGENDVTVQVAISATDVLDPNINDFLMLSDDEIGAMIEFGEPDDLREAPLVGQETVGASIPQEAIAAGPEAGIPEPTSAKPIVELADEGDRRAVGVQSIRVDLEKVDRVVNMVGELVITQSMLTQQMDETLRTQYTELVRGLEVLAQTTRGLQDSVMAIRAQPVKSVFSRMPRLVRELGLKTGKTIKLEMVGEATEIDKTVIEQLSDPLTHMIRNSADHGIESGAVRLAAGKPEAGTIRLGAEQAGGNILITIEDDGAGINRERVLQVARSRGVVAPDADPTDEQIDQLIFAPGFSTAEAVSDISGRGVGMDVVLSNIRKIGGSVNVRSRPGRGTRMTLRLPLTLAVLDVMLVQVGQSRYVVPLSSIVETIQCSRAAFSRVPSGGQVLHVRGEYVQVIDLAERFELDGARDAESRFLVLCEAEGSHKIALIVDDIMGQQQVVIKSLEENFERVEGIAGGTILGDGNVALIVDVQGLKASDPHRTAA